MDEKKEDMDVIVENSAGFEIEKISPHLQLLLRAAYIASLMHISSSFPHEQKRNFKQLEIKNWPIEIPKRNRNKQIRKLVEDIKENFESRILSDTRYFMDNQDKQIDVYELMSIAIKLPGKEKKLIQSWHGKEIEEIYNKKMLEQRNKIKNK